VIVGAVATVKLVSQGFTLVARVLLYPLSNAIVITNIYLK
jgi:hypothetical protein